MIAGRVEVEFEYYRPVAREYAVGITGDLVTGMGSDTVTYATIRTPVDTGRLRAANQLIVEAPSGWSTTARVVNETEYAILVHDGTAPHVIRPRNPGGVLRFEAASGDIVFATHVNHPGTPGRPFLLEGAEQAAAEHNFIVTDET